MFGFKRELTKDEKDALKWREHKEKEREKIRNEEVTLIVLVGLMDGEQVVLRKTLKGRVYNCPWTGCWEIYSAEQEAGSYYERIKDSVNTEGITIDGVTYMPHTISTITRLPPE